MKSSIKRIAKPIAFGVFSMALFFNVKVSLENPFIRLDNAALAQTSEGAPTCASKFMDFMNEICVFTYEDSNGDMMYITCPNKKPKTWP